MKTKTIFNVLVIAMIGVLSISSCKKDKNATPGPNEVFIQGSSFSPSSITVTAGTTITWTNKDNTMHTVTSNTAVFSSNNLSKSGTFSFTFTTAGTFPYHCLFHSGMTGTVIVQ
jgi:plastocyanin